MSKYEKMAEYLEDVVEKMGKCVCTAVLFTDNYKDSIEGWLQFGASIMLNKPIFLMVSEGTEIPEKVRRVADKIVFFGANKSLEDASLELKKFVNEVPE